MFQRILVPLDGSVQTEIALGPASLLARRFDAGLLLVSAGSLRSYASLNARSEELRTTRQSSAYLETAAHLLEGAGMRVEIASPADTLVGGITRRRQFHGLDLVVIVAEGCRGLDTLCHPGSDWSGLVDTSVPILAVRDTGDNAQSQHQWKLPRFMTCPDAPIMAPLDGSALAERALPIAQELARAFGNPLLLIRAAKQPHIASDALNFPPILARVQSWAIEEALSYLRLKQQEIQHAGLNVEIEGRLGTPAECIEACAQMYQPGLVVMALHGRSGLGRLVFGSAADRVLSQSHIPVLLVRIARLPMQKSKPCQGRKRLSLSPQH